MNPSGTKLQPEWYYPLASEILGLYGATDQFPNTGGSREKRRRFSTQGNTVRTLKAAYI